ncbi:MAG: PepSY domain-containing protein [Candidatus Woesearchaeota archaeon]
MKNNLIITILFLLTLILGITSVEASQLQDISSQSPCVLRDGSCCVGDTCASSSVMCISGTTPKFIGCSDSCTPELTCVNETTNSTCIVMPNCAAGAPIDSGTVDSNGCKIYSCTLPVGGCGSVQEHYRDQCCKNNGYNEWTYGIGCTNDNTKTTCSVPVCQKESIMKDTGQKDSNGCIIYSCVKDIPVCCESYSSSERMIKTSLTYSIMPMSECSVCKKDLTTGIGTCITGGRRNIVSDNYCSGNTSPACPIGCTCDASGAITCTTTPVCPNGCTCDASGAIISCTTQPVCPSGCTCSASGITCTTTPVCPSGCTCSPSGAAISCTTQPVCPSGCTCHASGAITCTTTSVCPNGCTCDNNGVTQCTKVVENKDIVQYYKNKIDSVVAADTTDNADGKIEALETLRKQIDETIISLIEQKKSIKYSDVKDISEKITITHEKIAIGTSTTSTQDVKIESDIEGTAVTIASSSESVTLSQDDVTAQTGDLVIDSDGINIDGIRVKLPPKAVLMRNHNLETNIQRVNNMKLEKEEDKAVYTIQYDADKKLLGIISTSASQEIKINANTGDVISEKKPWWTFLASDVKSEAISK